MTKLPEPRGMAKRYYSNCVRCGHYTLIRRMYSIYIKKDCYGASRLLYHICPECLEKQLNEMEVAMPTWEEKKPESR